MKVLFIDIEGFGCGTGIAMRAQDAAHNVRYWLPPFIGGELKHGKGILNLVEDWQPSMDWADLVILIGNSKYSWQLAEYFGKGYPIFGANAKGAELELDRGKGQEVLQSCGIAVPEFTVVDSAADAIAFIKAAGKPFAMKPWGGDCNKAMTFVGSTAEDCIFTLAKWQAEGLFKGQLMLQEKIDGLEIGIAGWFGPHGWSGWFEESFEHKKFLVGDLGENTGEMGTVIRHVKKSKLATDILLKLTDHLLALNYVGDCSVNCMVNAAGAWPMEFTMRLGWPDFAIRQEVMQGDPVEWMRDCIDGKDTFAVSEDIALGVLMAHGDFPKCKMPRATWEGYPISGVSKANRPHIVWQNVMRGKAVGLERTGLLTSGDYVAVVNGSGKTVTAAHNAAYAAVDGIKWPSNVMYRVDIGLKLKDMLPKLQALGYATGMEF